MTFLNIVLLNNPLRNWLTAMAVALACMLALKLFQKVVLHRISLLAEKTETQLDDLLVTVLNNTRFVPALLVSISLAGHTLVTTAAVDRALRLALILATQVQGAIWVSTAITFLLTQAVARRQEEDAGGVTALMAMALVAKFVLWSLFGLLVLSALGVNVTGLVAGLGVGGIAVALAVQNILGDLFASLSIVLDKPFAVGDFITVGDASGTVQHIGLKTTRVRGIGGEQIVFSNSDLLKSRIRNHKRMEERRVVFPLRVTLETPPETLAKLPGLIRTIIEAQDKVRFDRSHFMEIGAACFTVESVYFMLEPDYLLHMDTQQTIFLAIIRQLEAEGIQLAYPTQTLHHHPLRKAEQQALAAL